MPKSPLQIVVRQLLASDERASDGDDSGPTDGQLLGRYIDERDDQALALLVERHAPMVWGVCQRILPSRPDAEDAFQATFLVLIRKGAGVNPREMLANWLYGVARMTAVRLRGDIAKRSRRESNMRTPIELAAAEARDDELLALLDEELHKLPGRARALIVLCDLEGRTRRETARQLGCPEGTVASGLARALTLLAKRLTARGLSVGAASLASLMPAVRSSANLPETLLNSTLRAIVPGSDAPAAGLSARANTLSREVVHSMLLKTITSGVLLFALGITIVGTLIGTFGVNPIAIGQPATTEPASKRENDMEAFTAWGPAVGDLQAGLGFRPGERRAYRHGETVTLVVRVRNVGKADASLETIGKFFGEEPPTVTDSTGKPILQARIDVLSPDVLKKTPVPAGKVVELATVSFKLHRETKGAWVSPDSLWATGPVRLQYERLSAVGSPETPASRLATGRLDLEILERKAANPPKEGDVAWGTASGGLQAGLSLRPGQKKTYAPGDPVTLVVTIRNVGAKPVQFEYVQQFLDEQRPVITTADGKPFPQAGLTVLGTWHTATAVALEPGREIELESRIFGAKGRQFELVLNDAGRKRTTDDWPLYVAPGTIRLRYDRVLGNSSISNAPIDPDHKSLGTGTITLEISPAAKKPKGN
jgi:RNA polymerase sigma factor (sigma-70 family)